MNQHFGFVAVRWCMLLSSSDCLEGREVRNERFRDRVSGTPQQSFSSFADSFFHFGELGIGRSCCAAQATRETPPQHGRWSTTDGARAGAWGVRAKLRGGSSLRDGRGRCAPLDSTGVLSPRAKKKAPTLHIHTPAESVLCAQHYHALHSTHCVSHMCLCSLRRCGLVSACE